MLAAQDDILVEPGLAAEDDILVEPGLAAQHDKGRRSASNGCVRGGNDAGAAARTEHYEIAAYSGLIEMARALGEPNAVTLLDENLKEEKETLREVESVTKTLRDQAKEMVSR